MPPGGWRGFARNKAAVAAFAYVMLVALCALFAGMLSPHDPIVQYRDALLSPPAWDGGSSRFWLGTDATGRDLVSRLLHGARASLAIALGAVMLSALPGIALGLMAAFWPRPLGTVILRVTDVLLSLPALILAIALVAVLGPGLFHTTAAIALVAMPGYVRLVRASALGEMAKDYVTASKLSGAGTLRLMFDTVLPNCMGPVIVNATMGFSDAILSAAALGFLGLGAQPPMPEWGSMLSAARDHIENASWVVTMPGLAILSTVLAINMVGDGLRDALDPRLKAVR
ncbi:ABC transporter permease subunit [Piscinibacter sp. XHJ-5]|uniref:ABC transporter permease subunit n=1 Tax=Piscinibacter sp. XHJ-5 TaxID=3037797 RepID=UPI0024528631|nr:ABC transporter permease subunit [Piscinibacter sp. XHJ-5]